MVTLRKLIEDTRELEGVEPLNEFFGALVVAKGVQRLAKHIQDTEKANWRPDPEATAKRDKREAEAAKSKRDSAERKVAHAGMPSRFSQSYANAAERSHQPKTKAVMYSKAGIHAKKAGDTELHQQMVTKAKKWGRRWKKLKAAGKAEQVESRKWIQNAIKKPGALKKSLGVGKDEKIPRKKLVAASKKGGKLGKRSNLALTLRGLNK